MNFNVISNHSVLRKNFSKIKSTEPIPDLMEVQKNSYQSFLQQGIPKDSRKDMGLENVLRSIFPIYSNNGMFVLEYIDYFFEAPRYTVNECKNVGVTYAAALKVKIRLTTNEINPTTGALSIADVKEQEVFFAEIPLMVNSGVFIINGTERVVVSQIHRAPGVFFGGIKGQYTSSGKQIYSANIIPKRGSWLDIEFDSKDILYIKIDKRKKLLATVLLKSLYSEEAEKLIASGEPLGSDKLTYMSNQEILSTFYNKLKCEYKNNVWVVDFSLELFQGKKLTFDLVDANTGKVVLQSGTNLNKSAIRKIEEINLVKIIVNESYLIDSYFAENILDSSGKILFKAGDTITSEILEKLQKAEINNFDILAIDNVNVGNYIVNTLKQDKGLTSKKALKEIYKSVKTTEAPSLEIAQDFFNKLFFDHERYDLSEVGRVKVNERLGLNEPLYLTVLTKQDIINVIKQLIKIRENKDGIDDIDHLGNRRIRSVGELLETEVRISLVRIQRNAIDKMNALSEDIVPNDVINTRPLQATLKEFFGVSQLSQFMDQTNPLAEITHKRRLSALGPKGLSRERAGFEVRDVHPTHYGRICPIETPEGPNIGLINSLTIYAKVNQYGFLETPYYKVENKKITGEVVYLTANEEKGKIIAHSTVNISPDGTILDDFISCRKDDDFVMEVPESVDYIDISPKQMVSVAASLVPFLENDDANRALMGANMQRQAVPLLIPEAPLVGTGMEAILARHSEASIVAKTDGIVDFVDANKIIVKKEGGKENIPGFDIYILNKFQKSNHNTCINQKPLVFVGEKVKKGDILADGQSCDKGELALGKNVLVAFMPWNGYNFEDSILISERVVTNDVFTSVHIEEFEVVARDTKLGPEEITDDIPNVSEEALRNLDESGIVYIGAEVKTGDVIVGKITPKAESIVTPEEKLLKAIFGEKALDVKDTSLRVPSGVSGTVIGVRVFSRRGLQKDSRSLLLEKKIYEEYNQDKEEQYLILLKHYTKEVYNLLHGQNIINASEIKVDKVFNKDGDHNFSLHTLLEAKVKESKINKILESLKHSFDKETKELQKDFDNKVNKLLQGDDLPANVLKMVKVYIAVKRKLQPGDKMAGRHGNKGVVSKILPIQDMPYLEDGTPVDICLSPLGVPSRMNIGQILETHLGWAAANIGKKIYSLYKEVINNPSKITELKKLLLQVYGKNEHHIIENLDKEGLLSLAKSLKKGVPMATPVFDGAKEKDIDDLFALSGLDNTGQVTLIDGRTGIPFERKVTVGYMYMLKLHHLVDDKIHARSVGPYSLITQQPLGGKAQFGGQRFGEMEVWALEAYGASYILKEMLTVKSDDQVGRTKVYEAIIKGEETFETGIPESFNVLVKELRSLGLDLDMHKTNKESQN